MAGPREEQVPTTPLEIAYAAWMSAAAERVVTDAALARLLHKQVKSNPENYRSHLKEEDWRWLEKRPLEAKYINKVRTWRTRATLPSSEGLALALTEIITDLGLPPPEESTEWPEFAQVLQLLTSERGDPYRRGGESMQALALAEHDQAQRSLLALNQCLVRDLDPLKLGLGSWMFEGALPQYVHRDADNEVKTSLNGGVPGITVIVGPPKSGKTRSLFEMLQTEVPDKTVWWVKPAPRVLPQLVSTYRKERQNKPDLIVIDDAHLCRANPVDGLTATWLRELSKASRVILTIHDTDLADWKAQTSNRSSTRMGVSMAKMAGEISFGADRDLVELLEAHLIEFHSELHDDELKTASEIYPPENYAELDLTRMAEVFASITELIDQANKWQKRGGIHGAIIEAALDTAIAYPNGTTPEIIKALTMIHFDRGNPNGIWDDNGYREALTDATTGIGGPKSPHAILVKRHGSGHTLLEALAPRLIQDNRSLEHLSSAPFLDTEARIATGYWGVQQGQLEITKMHWAIAAKQGNITAMLGTGVLEYKAGNIDQARYWWEKAADLGDPNTMFRIGFLEQAWGNIDQARHWYEKAADFKNPSAMFGIGFLEDEAGKADQARYWWEKAADLGDPSAMFRIGVLEDEAGKADQARYWWEKAADLDNTDAMFGIAVLEDEAGKADQARYWLEKAADLGSVDAMVSIGVSEYNAGKIDQARYWWEKAADLDNTDAMALIGILEHEAGNIGQARYWWEKAAELGSLEARDLINKLDQEFSSSEQAEAGELPDDSDAETPEESEGEEE